MRKDLRIFLLSFLVVIFSAASVFAITINEAEFEDTDPYYYLYEANTEGYNYATKIVAELDGDGEAGDVVWEVTMENESDTWLKWKPDASDNKTLILEGVLPKSDSYGHGFTVIAHVSGDIDNPALEGYEGEEELPEFISGDIASEPLEIQKDISVNDYTVGTYTDLVEFTPAGVDLNTMTSSYNVTVDAKYFEGDDENDPYYYATFDVDPDDILGSVSLPAWLSLKIPARFSYDDDDNLIKYQIVYNSPLPKGDREGMVLVPAYPYDTNTYDDKVMIGWPVKYTAPSIVLNKPSKTDISMKYGTATTLSIGYNTVKPVDVAFDTDKMEIVSWNKPTGTTGTLNIIVKPVALSGDVAAKLIVYDDNDKSADIDFKFSIAESIAVSPDVITWNAGIEHVTTQTLNLLTSNRPVRYETSPEIPDNFNLTVDSDDASITLEVSPTAAAATYNGKITFYDADNNPAEVTLNIEPVEAILIKEESFSLPSIGDEYSYNLTLENSVNPVRYTAAPSVPANLFMEVLWGEEADEEGFITVKINPSGSVPYEGVLTFYDENGYDDSVKVKFTDSMSTPSGTTQSFTTYPGAGNQQFNLTVGDNYGEVSWTVGDGIPAGINAELSTDTGTSTTLNVYIDEDFSGDPGEYSFDVIAEDEAGQQVTFTINITVDAIPTINFGKYEQNISLDARFSKVVTVSFDTVAPVSWEYAEDSESDIESFVSFDVKFETSSTDANAGNMIVTMTPITSEINTEAEIKDDVYEVIIAVTDTNNQVVNFPLDVKIITPSLILAEESATLSAAAGSSGNSKKISLLADENSEYEAPVTPVSYEFSDDEPDEQFNFSLTSDDSSITFSIRPSRPGLNYDGTVTFYDAFGNSGTVDLELSSTSAGNIGITSDVDDIQITAGTTSNVTLTVNNAYGTVNWTVGNIPEWLTVTPLEATGNSVTFTIEADNGARGNYSFTVEAEDETGNSATFTIEGKVNVPELTLSNLPGTITAIYGQTTTETFTFSGTTIAGYEFANDISENVEVSVEYPTDSDSGNVTLSITPITMADETYSTTLTLLDDYGHEPQAELTIEVVVPKLVISEDSAEISANLGGSNSTALNLTGTYKAAPISWEASPEIDEGFGFSVESNDTRITLTAQPTEPLEDYEGAITFKDAYEHTDSVNLKIHVVSEEPFSITQTRGDSDITLNAEEGTTIAFRANEPKGTVTWTAGTLRGVTITPATATGNTATFTITAGTSAVNDGTVQFTATDGNTTVNATVTVTVIPKESATPEETKMNTESEDVVANLLETLGLSNGQEVAELPVDDDTIVSTEQRSAADVVGEVPSNETLKLVLPLITPTETKVYVFAIDRSKLRDLFKTGDAIFVHLTNKKTASASFKASASEGAKLVDDYGTEITTFPASGNINVAGLMNAGGSYSTIITSASSGATDDPEQPDNPEQPEQPEENSEKTLGSPSGTCNGGFGILALAVLGACLKFRQKISL